MVQISESRDSSFLEEACSVIKKAHEGVYKKTGLIINTSNITASQLLEEITKFNGVCLIATDEDTVVGTLSVFHDPNNYWFSKGKDCLKIKYVAVAPLYQGKHIASDLLEHATSIASEKGKILTLSTDQNNKHAIYLYKKNGFRIVDVTRGKKAKSNAVRMVGGWPVGCPFPNIRCQIKVAKGMLKCFLKKLVRF